MNGGSPWTRRRFLRTTASAGVLATVPLLARAEDAVRISILHTTDLHGHILPTSDYQGRSDLGGFARCVTQIRRWREENPRSIAIDIGDLYQGTDVALRTQGSLMIELLNLANYDAWVIGNHEFDWGIEPFFDAVQRSAMPVLAANSSLGGKTAGEFNEAKHPFLNVRPYLLKEFDGIKVAVIGITTPGMPFWFRPDFLGGIEFAHPVEAVRRAIRAAKAEGAHAIVLAGHMGLKERTGGDDFANHVEALTSEFPEVAVFLAGHTHKMFESRRTNGVILTQADHYGIYAGRVELLFDRNLKKLLHATAECVPMDNRIELDPTIISRSKPQLDASAAALAEPVGELAENLSARTAVGEPSDVERLIAAAVREALAQRGTTVNGVLHGLFDEKRVLAGTKSVNDIWTLLPYENYLVTAQLNAAEIRVMMEEIIASHEGRNLMGFEVRTEGTGRERRLTSIGLSGSASLDPAARYAIAFNTFDSRSGGHRFMKLREMLLAPGTNCTLHPVQVREALLEYFRKHKVVRRVA